MQELKWKRISEVKYRTEINGELKDLFIPYAKSSAIFELFVTRGGVIGEDGKVAVDPLLMFAIFKDVAEVILTVHDEKGKVLEEGNASQLAPSDLKILFDVGVDVLENFTKALFPNQSQENKTENQEEKEKAQKKMKKA